MGEITRPPIQFDIHGVTHQFEYGKTTINFYRAETDQPLCHIEAEEYGTQRVYLFNSPAVLRAMMFLVGQELPGHDMKKKEVQHLTTAMDSTVGWEADFSLKDQAPEEIKERYIKLSTAILRQEVLVIPGDWK